MEIESPWPVDDQRLLCLKCHKPTKYVQLTFHVENIYNLRQPPRQIQVVVDLTVLATKQYAEKHSGSFVVGCYMLDTLLMMFILDYLAKHPTTSLTSVRCCDGQVENTYPTGDFDDFIPLFISRFDSLTNHRVVMADRFLSTNSYLMLFDLQMKLLQRFNNQTFRQYNREMTRDRIKQLMTMTAETLIKRKNKPLFVKI